MNDMRYISQPLAYQLLCGSVGPLAAALLCDMCRLVHFNDTVLRFNKNTPNVWEPLEAYVKRFQLCVNPFFTARTTVQTAKGSD